MKNALTFENVTMLGKGIVKHVSDDDVHAFTSATLPLPENMLIHNRMIIKGDVFHSAEYVRPTRSNDTVVMLNNGKFGVIKKIVIYKDETGKNVPMIMIQNLPNDSCVSHFKDILLNADISSIKLCNDIDLECSLIDVTEINCKCVFVSANNKSFVINFPNRFEKD